MANAQVTLTALHNHQLGIRDTGFGNRVEGHEVESRLYFQDFITLSKTCRLHVSNAT